MYEDIINDRKEDVYTNHTSIEMCPQCASLDIDVYPVATFDVFFYYASCNECGYRWTASDV